MNVSQSRRPEFFPALLTTVTWAALAFAAIGVLSVSLDRDPVTVPAGPGYTFGALIVAGFVVWLAAAYSAHARVPWVGMVLAAAGSYLSICVVAFIGSLALFFEQAASPFVLVACLLAPSAVILCWLLARYNERNPRQHV